MKRPHYAWFVCLGGALSLLAILGLGINVFTIYQPEIISQNGFTNAQGSWITTTRTLANLSALFTVNWLAARIGVRRLMTLGVLLTALSYVGFGLAVNFPMYCAAAAFTGAGYCYGGMVPLALIINRWFQDRRGLALGLASAGSGVSTVLAPAIVTRLIQSQGLRFAFFTQAAVLAALAVLTFLFLRESPAAMGLEPYRTEHNRKTQTPVAAAPRQTATRALPFMFLSVLLLGGPGGPGFTHLTVLYTSEGYDSMLVAAFVSYLGLMISVAKIICGQVFDRFGSWVGNFYIYGMFLLGLLMSCLAPIGSVPLAFLAITAFALGIPVSTFPPSIWAGDLASEADYAKTVRAINLSYTVGMLIIGPVPGMMADRFGSYVPAYLLLATLLLASMIGVQLVYRYAGAGKRP